ncbi:MAG: Eco57I restriction-modification methylase domain-containing protein [Lachnospiraceae bacterium]|nr:Eco57I restriction-modification methylase domain-containing protein [Lachnospiraceae bacterium]
MERFDSTVSYTVIYVYSIPDDKHKGLLKVGMTTLSSDLKPAELVPNCRALNQAAIKRIAPGATTMGVHYDLKYTELGRREKDGEAFAFPDKKVHEVLLNSGIKQVFPDKVKGREWFETDLATVKAAIAAVKEWKDSLSSEFPVNPEEPVQKPIEFREEQEAAVEKTRKVFKKDDDMLWYAKMRFGKTLSALEVVRREQYQRVIIVTHRPVVDDGWSEDFRKVFFPGNSKHEYLYERKTQDSTYIFDEKTDAENDRKIRRLVNDGSYFIYFASVQDLRGSQLVGGNFNKNNAVFETDWDLIIVDEAHEGTQTELGDNVLTLLRKKKTKVLSLSGTPFNLLGHYSEDNVYTWDYVMEQRAKEEWDGVHFGDHNPYAALPKMHIFTYDLGDTLKKYVSDEYGSKSFRFSEFFRVYYKGPNGKRELPAGAVEGRFVNENDVKSFLDLLVREDTGSGYPYSTQEYRDMFRHTLWMVPGVKEAKALAELLRKHPVFGKFSIVNVAGAGDTAEESFIKEPLAEVKKSIKENDYTITLSCGKLTTGVTVPEWTACLMLSGNYTTAAAQYMQTIFRVQSPGQINGKQKTDCYVFDFAPDRTLKVLTETVHLSRKPGKSEKKRREAMTEFLNYCPVIAIAGSRTRKYSVESMMEQLKQIYAERAVNSGFEDESLYNDELLKLDEIDAAKFNALRGIIGSSKAAKKKDSVTVNNQGLTDEQVSHLFDDTEEDEPKKEPLTPEQLAEKLAKEQAKKARKKAIDILRGISIRMPLMIYGADVSIEEDIDIDDFVNLVDDESWQEFMPQGVTKKIFADFTKYYDRDVFIAAGKRIRRMAAAADEETPTRRVGLITEIFRHFKNPDKETVLTPWRVVNMHMSDTLGGWCFFNDRFEEDTEEEKKRLEEPRFVDRGRITRKVFSETSCILELNSKTGLYPLYVAYSSYKQKMEGMSDDDWEPRDCQEFWDETIENNIFVICKTPMAKQITIRTLCGYSKAKVNIHYFDDLVNMLRNKPEQFKQKVLKGNYWKKEVSEVRFNALACNPPYQELDSNEGRGASPIFPLFVEAAKNLEPDYVSMIIPARWYAGGKGLDDFREKMLKDKHITKLVDIENSKECFPTADIAGGVCYFLWERDNESPECEVVNISHGEASEARRKLDEYPVFIRSNEALSILKKVLSKTNDFMEDEVLTQKPFGFRTYERGKKKPFDGAIKLIHSEGVGYVSKTDVGKNEEKIDRYKVVVGRFVPGNGEIEVKPSEGYRVTTKPKLLYPGEICTETYIVVATFEEEAAAKNFIEYYKCRFPRFLLRLSVSSVNISKEMFRFVPKMDFSHRWADEELYRYFGLTESEQQLIEKTMRSMNEPGYYEGLLSTSYANVVNTLLKKYGKAKHDYFKDTNCTTRNKLASRAESEGLYCHHIDEDKAILLSNDKFASKNPFEYQKANRLVYCNVLEHLILHTKIAEEPRNKDANADELQGIGGAVTFLCKELNDIYSGKEYTEEWRQKIAEQVKDSFDDYISVLKHLWNVIKENPIYRMIITKESLCVGTDGKVVQEVLAALD